tara:strand:- start:7040 stop:7870 length:831 start_codon:yes stop_codon:yes gene_type:complete
LVAPGPTLSQIDTVADYDLAIFVGDSFKRTKFRAKSNAYMRANTEYPRLDVDAHIDDLGDFVGDLIFASSVMESNESVSTLGERALGGRDFFVFDQRHFGGSNCSRPGSCCKHALEITIQEQLAESIGIGHHYSEGTTVLAHALALAILLGPLTIDIVGADLPLKRGLYVYSKSGSGFTAAEEKSWISKEMAMHKMVRRLKIATSLGPKRLFGVLKHKLALALLGNQAPSVFAEDFIELLTDFQYLADAAAHKKIDLRVHGKDSLLNRVAGFSSAG